MPEFDPYPVSHALLSLKDEQWKRVRNIVTPSFSAGKIKMVSIQSKSTVKSVSSDHIKQDILFAFLTGVCLLLHKVVQQAPIQELSALLSYSNKQPAVYSDFHVT